MVRIGAYVGRAPVTSTVVCDVVQTNAARSAFRADISISQYKFPGVTGMRGVNPS